MTLDHRVAGSSPAECKWIINKDLRRLNLTVKSILERITYHSLTTFQVYPPFLTSVQISPARLFIVSDLNRVPHVFVLASTTARLHNGSGMFAPFNWLRSAVGVIRQTDKSSGFHPMILTFFLCLLGAMPILVWNGGNALLEIFAVIFVSVPLLCLVIVFSIKAFTDPDFCRSERHIEHMAKIEAMGTEELAVSATEIETATLEPAAINPPTVHKLADKNQGGQNE